MLDLTLNGFKIPNMPSFNNEFGVKKTEPGKGCSTAELTQNMMMPFLRMRPISVTSNTSTSEVEADAAINLVGEITALTLGPGSFRGVELKIINDASAAKVQLLTNNKVITTHRGEVINLRWNGTEWRKKTEIKVGGVLPQYPGESSPIEDMLEGTYIKWNDRAMLYRLTQNAIPTHTVYQPGANYAINAVVMWHLEGDDWAFYAANRAITAASAQLDPVMWDQVKTGEIIERRHILDINPWTDNDLEIGSQISGGQYDGYFVEEIIVFGGKFFGNSGGNRPPFVTGGVQGDAIRNITGEISGNCGRFNAPLIAGIGIFTVVREGTNTSSRSNDGSNNEIIKADASRVVPTADDNRGRNISVNWFLRIN